MDDRVAQLVLALLLRLEHVAVLVLQLVALGLLTVQFYPFLWA